MCLFVSVGVQAFVRAFACAHARVYAACLRVRVCVCVHARMNLSQWFAQRDPPFISSNAVGWSRTRHYQHGTCTHTPTISLPAWYARPKRVSISPASCYPRVWRVHSCACVCECLRACSCMLRVPPQVRHSEADCRASAAHCFAGSGNPATTSVRTSMHTHKQACTNVEAMVQECCKPVNSYLICGRTTCRHKYALLCPEMRMAHPTTVHSQWALLSSRRLRGLSIRLNRRTARAATVWERMPPHVPARTAPSQLRCWCCDVQCIMYACRTTCEVSPSCLV